jgi:hypothetical protein
MAKINQKYFGNRNIGTGGQQLTVDANGNVITPADDKIGGEGVASYTIGAASDYQVDTTHAAPTYAVKLPSEPGGVRATVVVHWEVASISISNGLSGHNYVVTNSAGTLASFTGLTGVRGTVTARGSGQGEIQTMDFSYTGSYRGDFTTIPNNNTSYQVTQPSNGDGNQQATVKWRIKSIEITEKGSGYISVADALLTFTGGTKTTAATATAVLTTDSGAPGSSTNQENAILAYAKTTSGGTSQVADIIKQRGTKRFKVRTADGTAICALKAGAVSAVGEMTIAAVDDTNGTYYVTKIGGRRCTIVQNNGTAFATNSSVPWVFSKSDPAYNAATTVIIANA